MGITREEFSVVVKGMKAIYSNNFIQDKDAFDVWYGLLKDLPYEVVSAATQKYMMTEKFPPTPADIRRYASGLKTDTLTETEAWDLVRKACQSLDWDNPGIEYDKLPKVIQRAVVSPQYLVEMARSDMKDFETVIASNFMRSFKAAAKQQAEEEQLPLEFRQRIETMRNKYIGEGQNGNYKLEEHKDNS